VHRKRSGRGSKSSNVRIRESPETDVKVLQHASLGTPLDGFGFFQLFQSLLLTISNEAVLSNDTLTWRLLTQCRHGVTLFGKLEAGLKGRTTGCRALREAMSRDSDVVGIGILGAANIARKNARGIALARNNIGSSDAQVDIDSRGMSHATKLSFYWRRLQREYSVLCWFVFRVDQPGTELNVCKRYILLC
jgi:hypothetical protein